MNNEYDHQPTYVKFEELSGQRKQRIYFAQPYVLFLANFSAVDIFNILTYFPVALSPCAWYFNLLSKAIWMQTLQHSQLLWFTLAMLEENTYSYVIYKKRFSRWTFSLHGTRSKLWYYHLMAKMGVASILQTDRWLTDQTEWTVDLMDQHFLTLHNAIEYSKHYTLPTHCWLT